MQRSHLSPARRAFTLIELLVVILIIGMLVAILLPAVQAARVAARNNGSKNNLRQIALASANYESGRQHFPPSAQFTPAVGSGVDSGPWSIFALLLPFVEQELIQSKIDFTQSYALAANVTTADGSTVKLGAVRVPPYLSPAEPRDEARVEGGVPTHYPLNYAVNLGTWLVYDPATKTGGDGVAYPNSKVKAGAIKDGLSNTLGFSEVKAWNPYYRNAGQAAPAMPTSTADICSLGGEFKANSGHTEWIDGRAHQIGFTSVFGPNTRVACTSSGTEYDVDWTNWQEGKGLLAATPVTTPTYAAVTARGYFSGMVNVAMMDGSVRAIDNTIHLGVWRAISTRAGAEVLPDDFNR